MTIPSSLATTTDPGAIPEDPEISRAHYAGSRLRLALYDLGLESLVESGWVRAEGNHVELGSLSARAADRLARHLEDLVSPGGVVWAKPDDGPQPVGEAPVYEQLSLFDPAPAERGAGQIVVLPLPAPTLPCPERRTA